MPYINRKKQEELQGLQQLYSARIKIAKYKGITLGLGIAAIIIWVIQMIGWLIRGYYPLTLILLGGLVILVAFLIPCFNDFKKEDL